MEALKKIGIVTICDDGNYGNRLQNFAVQEIFESAGLKALTLKNVSYTEYRYTKNLHRIKEYIKAPVKAIKADSLHNKAIDEWNSNFHKSEKRYENFMRFNSNINYADGWMTDFKNDIDLSDFSAFAVGSDQVFNYRYGRANRIDFLGFAGKKPRFAISASIGVDIIPSYMKLRFKHYLKKFSEISVREKTAVKTLEDVLPSNIKVENIIDPTLAVDSRKWEELSSKAECNLPEKYVLLMYFGNLEDINLKAIEAYAKENECEIVRLNCKDNKYYDFGPYEFLYAIKNADMVFTDSFHTSVFSLLFKTSFYAARRVGDDETIFSRIADLLEMFNLSDRILEGQKCEKISESCFASAYECLDIKRQEFNKFIEKCVSEIGE